MRFFVDPRRRGVLKIATGYLVVSWLTLENGHTLFNVFQLPHAGLQSVFALLALGFPVTLFGAWQGWFGSAFQGDAHQAPAAGDHPHAVSHHEGPWSAGVFAAVALFAVAVAIGVRFFGMGHAGHGEGEVASSSVAAAPQSAAPIPFSPPAHSVAVLPFVNMSGDPKQDYFSDGLSDELLNSLASIRDLQVAARTSSFFFKGKDPKLSEVARELNVGSVLEGSVRKDGGHVRITAQLVNAVTGFELCSHAYDLDLTNILALQTEIATAMTRALQATLLPNAAASVELGGTLSPQAFDAYLQVEKYRGLSHEKDAVLAQVAAYEEAIRRDPKFAKAYIGKAYALAQLAGSISVGLAEQRAQFAQARAAAEKAVDLAPELGLAHATLGYVLDGGLFDFTKALREHERARVLAPGDAQVLAHSALFLVTVGRTEAALADARRTVVLDPINPLTYMNLGNVLYFANLEPEAIEAFGRALRLNPGIENATAYRGLSYLAAGDPESVRQTCATSRLGWRSQLWLALAYQRLNRLPEANKELTQMMSSYGDTLAYQYAEIYAQWNDIPNALRWLDRAYSLRDSGLSYLKVDRLLQPLRKEPRDQEIERKLGFPT